MVSAIVGVVALVIGLGVGWVLHSVQASSTPAPAGGVGVLPPQPHPAQIPPLQPAPRPDAKLVETLIFVHDLAEARQVQAEIAEGLQQSGVHPLSPQRGAMFDPAQHKAVDRAIAASPMDVDTIAGVVRPGWASSEGVIRFAEVAVFSPPQHAASGPQ